MKESPASLRVIDRFLVSTEASRNSAILVAIDGLLSGESLRDCYSILHEFMKPLGLKSRVSALILKNPRKLFSNYFGE